MPAAGRAINRAYVSRWIREHDFFVAHSFRHAGWARQFRRAIDKGFARSGLRPLYMDQAPSGAGLHVFQDYIKPAIRELDFGIFDLSFGRPNVFLELGTALAFARKNAYVVYQKGRFRFDKELSDLSGLYRGDCEYRSFSELGRFIRDDILRHRRRLSRLAAGRRGA